MCNFLFIWSYIARTMLWCFERFEKGNCSNFIEF